MRFSAIASAAALAPALASAAYTADLKNNLGKARVHNRCPYPVYLWSVHKGDGCDQAEMTTLKTGESYEETYRDDRDAIGVSIKISKDKRCKGDTTNDPRGDYQDITQLEYHINHAHKDFHFNFLDVSFVDCLNESCPGRDKFFLKSGNNGDPRLATAGIDKAVCPQLRCSSKEECATMAYILPDDVQTKSCEPAADMDFYMCVDNAEDQAPEEQPEAPEEEESAPTPIVAEIKAASAPEITAAPVEQPKHNPKIKTEVVYVTKYEYVNAKRHAHNHARAHGHRKFRA
ncbi:hypothetical protein M011DRAFT_478337 [Sporormia fimetaria CBS 119925]|uniref:Osmotin, thaumatin-like protein n=1 Tax=Sporormia fimetaria CBS 119925 TaxID=1340428 RepID=A0A6A6VB38_9PLEO|nr:hypothetical protein M011DRAFT_478337 [Sporormia fimetaria CBS 119925]